MGWWNNYVGIPFKNHGRDKYGCDCWGLVRLVLKEVFEIDVPDLGDLYKTPFQYKESAAIICNINPEWRKEWVPVVDKNFQSGDIVIWRNNGFPSHVCVVTKDPYFLHVENGIGSCIENMEAAKWENGFDSAWRHVSRCQSK